MCRIKLPLKQIDDVGWLMNFKGGPEVIRMSFSSLTILFFMGMKEDLWQSE